MAEACATLLSAQAAGLGGAGVQSVGVDRMGHLVARHQDLARDLNWSMVTLTPTLQ